MGRTLILPEKEQKIHFRDMVLSPYLNQQKENHYRCTSTRLYNNITSNSCHDLCMQKINVDYGNDDSISLNRIIAWLKK